VYVRAFPDRGAKWQVSNSGGAFPVWSARGNELFYRNQDNRIMVVDYTVRGAEFVPGKPRLWSPSYLYNLGVTSTFDVAPDGKRVAALMAASAQTPRPNQSHVTLVLNAQGLLLP
jgi:serine/threonine-protein kinase